MIIETDFIYYRYGMSMINANPAFEGIGVLMQFAPKSPKTKEELRNEELLKTASLHALARLGLTRDQGTNAASNTDTVIVGWKDPMEASQVMVGQSMSRGANLTIPTQIPAVVALAEGEMVRCVPRPERLHR
jgi:hypothetical protein